jgi:biopolymer transport protein ExbB/TolQ
MILSITWSKFKAFCLKYWQIFVGAFIALAAFVKFWIFSRTQKRILKNAVESEKKINEINTKYDANVRAAEDKARKDHDSRVAEINLKREEEKKAAKKELEERIEKNRNSSTEDLANRLGESFGVDVVLPTSSSNANSGPFEPGVED